MKKLTEHTYKIKDGKCYRTMGGNKHTEEISMNISNKLLTLRSMYSLTQVQAGLILGITSRRIQTYENVNGIKSTNTLNTLLDILLENPKLVKKQIEKHSSTLPIAYNKVNKKPDTKPKVVGIVEQV